MFYKLAVELLYQSENFYWQKKWHMPSSLWFCLVNLSILIWHFEKSGGRLIGELCFSCLLIEILNVLGAIIKNILIAILR